MRRNLQVSPSNRRITPININRKTQGDPPGSRERSDLPMKITHLLVALMICLACTGCKKLVHVVIVNRYASDVVLIEDQGPVLRIVAGGSGVYPSDLQTGQKFEFELKGGRRLTHTVTDVRKRMGDGKAVYVIDLDPASKSGAGDDKFPAFEKDFEK